MLGCRAMRSVVLVTALLVAGCGAARPLPSSRGAFAALAEAMRRPDGAAAAYAMLPDHARAATSFADFARRWDATRVEREEAARGALAALDGGGPVATVRAWGRDGTLVEERAGWRVADPSLGAPAGARAPGRAGIRAALRGLHDALRRRDIDAVLAALSGRLRGSVEAELASMEGATADPDALEVPEVPGQARVRLPDGRVVVLLWEDGQWRVDDVVDP